MKRKLSSAILYSLILSTTSALTSPAVTTNFSGTLTTEQTFYRPNFNNSFGTQLTLGAGSFTAQLSSLYSYLAQSLTPTASGMYDIRTTGGAVNDPFLLLYSSFDPNKPMDNIIVGNDDDGSGLLALLSDVSMTTDTQYVLVVTSFGAGAIGNIDFQTVGIGGITVQALSDSYFDSTIEGGGATPEQAAASALDKIKAGNNPEMDSFFTSLDALSTDEEVAEAIESTTPQTTAAGVAASSQISNGISGIVEQRQNVNIGQRGLSSGDEMFVHKNVWVKPFGSFGSQNDKDGINGFDLNAYGLGIGFDGEYKDNQNLGVALFYTRANIDVNNVSQSSKLDVLTTLVYGNIPIIDDKTNFLYQVGYAWQMTDSTRDISLTSQRASANYTSKTASLDIKLIRDYQVNNNLLLQPMISTTYRHFTNPTYSETGAGSLNLEVNKFTSTELLLGIGTMIHYKLDNDSKLVGNVKLDYDLHDNKQTVTSSYKGANTVSYDTSGIDNGRVSYDLGIGYEQDISDTTNFNISYNYQAEGSDFKNNTISAKFIYNF